MMTFRRGAGWELNILILMRFPLRHWEQPVSLWLSSRAYVFIPDGSFSCISQTLRGRWGNKELRASAVSSELPHAVSRQVFVHFRCRCFPLHLSQCHSEKLVPRLLKLSFFLWKAAGKEKCDCRLWLVYSTLTCAHVLASIKAKTTKRKRDKILMMWQRQQIPKYWVRKSNVSSAVTTEF